MSTPDPFVPGAMLSQYRLGERLTPSVWKAEDTRSGKHVAVKILSRQLPRDAAKRDALIREVRLGAALYHTSLVNILEIAPVGDALILAMDLVDGENLSTFVKNKPVDRTVFFRIAYQCADALRLLHAKDVIHGNLTPDSILITPAGQVKIAGLNVATFLRKREGQPSAFQLRGNDPRAVAYMAPEQITNQAVTVQTDIYSLGLVLYEAAVGKPAYQGASAAEIARKAVAEPPPNPKTLNPNIDNAVLGLIGHCLFKDSFKRYKDAKALVDDINRFDADAASFATDLARAATNLGGATSTAKSRTSILLIADIADYDKLEAADAAAAQKAAARMQQLVGEAAYLFDGEVLDPFGPRVIAELPSVENALEAARKAEFDMSPSQQEGEPLAARMLLHAGQVVTHEGKVIGDAVTKGFEILQTVPPLKLLLSEEFAKKAKGAVRLRDAGARAGTKLYEIVPTEKKPEPATEINTAELEAEARAEAEAIAAQVAAAAAKRKKMQLAAVAIVVVMIAVAAAVFVTQRPQKKSIDVVKTQASVAPATAATPRKIFIEPLTIEGTDPAFPPRAAAVRLAAIEIFRTMPELHVSDAGGVGITTFAAKLRAGAAGPELVAGKAQPSPAPDAASAIESLVRIVRDDVKLPPRPAMNPAALNAFADAVAAFDAKDNAKTEAALRASIAADPQFLPAQLLALRFFDLQGRDNDALEAAKQVAALDPTNADAARRIARASLRSGDLGTALSSYAVVLKKTPTDTEALNTIGRYATAVPDAAKLNAVLARIPQQYAVVHEPDILVANGRIDDAVSKYYDIERRTPGNAALCLKIGRIAVLRHSAEIASIELTKLEQADQPYAKHLLKAYIAASNNSKSDAAAELKAALEASMPGDDYWTSAAEVDALSNDPRGALEALEKAAARKEPTAAYILNSPLFRFLTNDPRFAKVREALAAEQNEVRTALTNIAL